jgi:hypothetical protein
MRKASNDPKRFLLRNHRTSDVPSDADIRDETKKWLLIGIDSHVTKMLYGEGTPLTNSVSVSRTAAYVDTIGEPKADLRLNIAAATRSKIIYERPITVTDTSAWLADDARSLASEVVSRLMNVPMHAVRPQCLPNGAIQHAPHGTSNAHS